MRILLNYYIQAVVHLMHRLSESCTGKFKTLGDAVLLPMLYGTLLCRPAARRSIFMPLCDNRCSVAYKKKTHR